MKTPEQIADEVASTMSAHFEAGNYALGTEADLEAIEQTARHAALEAVRIDRAQRATNAMLVQSDDLAKRDLELQCQRCGEHLCDAEPDDDLNLLLAVARNHDRFDCEEQA